MGSRDGRRKGGRACACEREEREGEGEGERVEECGGDEVMRQKRRETEKERDREGERQRRRELGQMGQIERC